MAADPGCRLSEIRGRRVTGADGARLGRVADLALAGNRRDVEAVLLRRGGGDRADPRRAPDRDPRPHPGLNAVLLPPLVWFMRGIACDRRIMGEQALGRAGRIATLAASLLVVGCVALWAALLVA
jgi:hypothetical protein